MSGIHIDVDADGHIVRTTPGADTIALPGFVNVHSHAFQRALRGRVEEKSKAHPNDDFWSWRTTMYADARALSVADVEALAAWAYADMVRAGYVVVGEFHYLHHPAGMSAAVARAAQRVGIELVLLQTAYLRGGFERELVDEQRRFVFPDVGAFLDHVQRTRDETGPLGAHTAVAIHSVRAVPRDAIEKIARFAQDAKLVLHAHACEQRKEIEDCLREHNLTPIALLARCGALGPRTTVVHATHLEDADVALLATSGASVCLTPSTERNLGDGLCRVLDLHAKGVPLCIGSDSHARIDVVDELRAVEENERLRLERRNVLTPAGDRLAGAVLPVGTRQGASALGVDLGRARVLVGMPLEGRAGDSAAGLDAWLVAGSWRDVVDVDSVRGAALVRNGKLKSADRRAIESEALAVLKRLTHALPRP